jgi:acetyl esterase/lipase
VIVCPGGGYGGRAGHEHAPIAEWLASLGLAAAVVDYRVAPYRHPVPLGDAQRAIRLVRANAAAWGVDPQRIGILGFSAGGHLAASAATLFGEVALPVGDAVDRESCRPDALIACYPVITFREPHLHRGSMLNLLGDPPPATLREQLSLETRVTSRTPPSFIWHTADDAAVPVANSLLLAEALGKCGVPYALHVFPHGPHGLGLARADTVVGRWTELCADWLGEIGWR